MPPKKGQKMTLNDFLADESTGKTSWADEMDDLPISSAPRDSSYRRGGDFLSTVPDRVDRDRGFERPERSYPPREELPLPDKPPFTAFVGNLSFDVMEADVEDFFAPSKTVSVRIVTGHDGKPKGFGYVEFQSQDDLRAALDRSGSQLASRTVRISVAEPPKSAFGGDRPIHSSQADDASQWRRAGPLPPAEPRGGFAPRPERSGVPRTEGSGFDGMDVSAGVRSGFGGKFQSAPPSNRPPRDLAPAEPSQGDLASQWRTGKPVEGRSPANSRRPSGMADSDSRRSSFRQRSDANDVDERFASQERMGFGSKFVADQTPPESPGNAKKGFGFGAADRRSSGQPAAGAVAAESTDNWRSAKKPSSGSSSPAPSAAAPVERKKLDLKPRSAESAAAASAATTSSKPSPFGNAKPIDASERERQIEEKLSQREKERQEELRIKKEKAKADKEKKDKVDTSAAATTTDNAQTDAAAAEAAEAAAPAAETAAPVAAKAPRAAPPTGAWGGGRKPSGALVGGEQGPAADATDDDKTAEAKVDEVAEKVQETKIEA
ncbi:related to TIF3-translation initiation factor eIF-4B [Sporisorium reilianum f. sp. reilianum]|uniref:Related to TIF3-translation initiation factor eIF-4B n=1 Tax=Sporisorium reilianum f. sp. reilianum TaxID=72559 RepID=A0A2N8UNC8_9BASI|nr:related to TIF3-translation initiation factor eIF-4B [Sporisorium reilianum f. sp. reilianum]